MLPMAEVTVSSVKKLGPMQEMVSYYCAGNKCVIILQAISVTGTAGDGGKLLFWWR